MTTRAKPDTSWQSACRHFFRHVDDPIELRRNPIAKPFFQSHADCTDAERDVAAIQEIHAAILTALGNYELEALAKGQIERARRRRTIVVSQILGHRPPENVAAELNVSDRQFYRERSAICACIARSLGSKGTPHTLQPSSVLNAAGIALTRGKLLVEGAEPSQAIAALRQIAREAPDAACKIEALCVMANAMIAQIDYAGARTHIRAARTFLSTQRHVLPEPLVRLCEAYVNLTEASLAFETGHSAQAHRLARTALSTFRDRGCYGDAQEIYIDGVLLAAEQAFNAGRFSEFRDHLAVAQSQLSHSDYGSRLTARLYHLLGFLCKAPGECSAVPTFEESNNMLVQARDIAQRDGLVVTAVSAVLDFANNCAFGLGDAAAAVAQARPTLNIALQTGNRALTGFVCARLSSLFNAAGHYRESIHLREVAKQHGELSPINEQVMHAQLAEAYLGLRDYRRARSLATAAFKGSQRIHNRRLQAAALRACALAHFGSRDLTSAHECIEESLRLAGRYGTRHSIASTYFVSAAITGNQEHGRVARALNPAAVSLVARLLPRAC